MLTIGIILCNILMIAKAYGFVDGNNNGKDDVKETWYYLDINATKAQSELNCMNWNGTWDGNTCKGLPQNITSVWNITEAEGK
jgi:hypothetical protein